MNETRTPAAAALGGQAPENLPAERSQRPHRDGAHLVRLPESALCAGCACRAGTEAHGSAETLKAFAECVASGEPFWCHESVAVRDKTGWLTDKAQKRYRPIPERQWKLCQGWLRAVQQRGIPIRHRGARA